MSDVPVPAPPAPASPPTARAPSPLSRVTPRAGAASGPIIGIDLGTTFSCVASVRAGRAFVIPSKEGHHTIPSIVARTPKGTLVVGHPAKAQQLMHPRDTVFGAKRLVGRPFVSDVVQAVKEHFQYEIVEGPDGEAAVRLGPDVWSLQELSAMILVEAREQASAVLGAEVRRAVVTVPAYYNEHQRQAVRAAGELAGLSVERILNEPTAAALAFGHGKAQLKTVLVYDLGGGTFDASLLQLGGGVYEVLATGGDTFLGGVDFDHAIGDHLLALTMEKLGPSFHPGSAVRQRLVEAAEAAKRALSEQQEARVHVPFLAQLEGQPPFDLDVVLTRAKVQELCWPMVERTLDVCREVLKAGGKAEKDLDDVVLVGGMSRMPLVHERLTAVLGRKPTANVHPDEAVALGAALFADSLGQEQGVTLIDVLPMSIGVGLPRGRFKKVIERNTKLPHTKTYGIATVKDDQEEMEVSIFQGESELSDECEYLGTAKLGPLPKGPRGTITVAVEFALSAECLLTVTAREVSRNLEVKATFSTKDTPEVVKARLERSERIAAAVKAAKAAQERAAHATKVPTGSWLSRLVGKLLGRKA